MRPPRPATAAHAHFACLLLFALFSGVLSNVLELHKEQLEAHDKKFRPPRGGGGPFPVTAPRPLPELRWTFEGLDYDRPPHQVTTLQAQKDHTSCVGEYTRCILRETKMAEMCVADTSKDYYYNVFSVCEIEYANCRVLSRYYKQKQWTNYKMNEFMYEGDGWWSSKDTKFWDARYSQWWCYLPDVQFYWLGMRRAAASILNNFLIKTAALTSSNKGNLQLSNAENAINENINT